MIRILAACALIGGCATAVPRDPLIVRTSCDVEVSFGSYAMGVDQELKARVLEVVSGNADVAGSVETPWGREGESTLCIMADDAVATDRLYDRIVDLLPRDSERAPTTVTHADGRSRAVGMPPERQ